MSSARMRCSSCLTSRAATRRCCACCGQAAFFACTDFLQPIEEVSQLARTHVYDRVRWGGGYSLAGYQNALTAAGFEVVRAEDLERHIRQTYQVLGRTASERAGTVADVAAREWMLAFADSCLQIEGAIDRGEFGWGMIVARKPGGTR